MVSLQGKCHHTTHQNCECSGVLSEVTLTRWGDVWQNFSFFEGTVGLLHCPHMNIVQFWTLCVKLSNTSFGLLELIHIANAIFWPIIRMFVTIIWGYFDDPSLFISCQSTSKKIIQHMTLTVIRTYCTHCSCNLKLLVMLPLINFSEQFSSISTFLSFLLSEFSFF